MIYGRILHNFTIFRFFSLYLQDKRYLIVDELYNVEKEYVECLTVLVDVSSSQRIISAECLKNTHRILENNSSSFLKLK